MNDNINKLRQRAETLVSAQTDLCRKDLDQLSAEEIRRMVHELQVHQIELELQSQELQKSNAELDTMRIRYFNLFDQAPTGYLTMSDNGVILDANLTATVMLGIPRSALTHQPITRFIAKEDQDVFYQHRHELFTTGKRQTCELRILKQDNTVFWAQLVATVAKDPTGALSCRVVMSDITSQKQTEVELMKMQKLQSLGILAGGIAHDFNNILMGLFGYIALMKDAVPEDHPGFSSLENAEKCMNRAIRLTHQLLTFSTGGDPVTDDIRLGTLVEDTARFDLSGSNVMLVCQQDPDLWLAKADKGQIQQVVSSLTLNARQAMPVGGHLYITLKNETLPEGAIPGLKSGNYIKMTLRDEGVGIDPHYIERIFDLYFTTKPEGHGLGLAITYSIVTKHGGHIGVESEPGKGTTFTLYLPASESGLHLHPKPVEEGASAIKPGTRILVLDDDDYVRLIMARWLNKINCVTETTGGGQQAIDMYQHALQSGHPYDVIILDLTIPGGMGGEVVLESIRKLHPQVKAIACSGYAKGSVLSNFASYGFKAALAKPFTESELQTVLRQLV